MDRIRKLHGGQVFLLEIVILALAVVVMFALTAATDDGATYFSLLVAEMGIALMAMIAIPWIWLSGKRQ